MEPTLLNREREREREREIPNKILSYTYHQIQTFMQEYLSWLFLPKYGNLVSLKLYYEVVGEVV
jgi:hypothetical protein